MALEIKPVAELVKYRLSVAVSFSAVTGFFLAGSNAGPGLLYVAAGVFLLSSGAAALNQVTERSSDALMSRTAARPVPSGRISPASALAISIFLIGAGSLVLSLNGILPVTLGLINVFLYNFIYTKLKKISVLAIVPGGLVGAIPPLIGFVSAGGNISDPAIVAFSSFMFLWQLPHFWLLIVKYGSEYENAGFASISKVLSQKQIKYLVFFWVLVSTAFLLLFLFLSANTERWLVITIALLNLAFISLFYLMLFREHDGQIRKAFLLINIFSIIVMIILIAASLAGAV